MLWNTLSSQYLMVFEQVKFSLEAAKSAQSNASIGIYDASAGTLFIDFMWFQNLVTNFDDDLLPDFYF